MERRIKENNKLAYIQKQNVKQKVKNINQKIKNQKYILNFYALEISLKLFQILFNTNKNKLKNFCS